MAKLKEIYIGKYVIQGRDGEDLQKWFAGIDSIVFPSSVRAKVNKDGEWQNCIVSGRVSEHPKGFLDMQLIFSDTTAFFVSGPKSEFLPESYIEAEKEEKEREKERRGCSHAGRRNRIAPDPTGARIEQIVIESA